MTTTNIVMVALVWTAAAAALEMTTLAQPRTVAVTGATGRLGSRVVEKLAARGDHVRCLQRIDTADSSSRSQCETPSQMRRGAHGHHRASSPGTVEYVRGDLADVASLTTLLKGCSACVAAHGATRRTKLRDLVPFSKPQDKDPTHAKQVNYRGVENLLKAAKQTGCSRVVRVTGKGEAPFSIFSILINGLGSMAKAYNYEGECLLRDCHDVDYTIVRPGVMRSATTDDSSSSEKTKQEDKERLALADDGKDLKVTPISHDAVADLIVASLDAPNARRATLTAMTTDDPNAPTTWAPLLASVRADARVFPKTLLDRHRLAVRLGFACFAVLFAGIFVGVLKLLAFVAAVPLRLGLERLGYSWSWIWEDIFAFNEM